MHNPFTIIQFKSPIGPSVRFGYSFWLFIFEIEGKLGGCGEEVPVGGARDVGSET